MRALRDLEEIARRIEHEALVLQLDLATRMVKRAVLELRYNADQPRVPAGSSDGGQWTSEGGSGGAPGLPAGTRRVAQRMGRITFSGPLIKQERLGQGWLSCTFYDSREDHYFSVPFLADKCPTHIVNW